MTKRKNIKLRVKVPVFILTLAAVLPLISGCHGILPKMNEINDFEAVQVLCIDKRTGENTDEKTGNIEITTIAGMGVPGSEGDTSGKSAIQIMSAAGVTVFDALNHMYDFADKRKNLGYIDYLLIGEEAAREDLGSYIDFYTRYNETRFASYVFIVRGGTAKDFISQTVSTEREIAESLKNTQQIIEMHSNFNTLRVIDLINMLDDSSAAAVVPALKCVSSEHIEMVGAEMPEMTIMTAGYAVIRDLKLSGYIDNEIARGYNFLMDEVFSTPFIVMDSYGKPVSLEASGDSVLFDTVWDGGELTGIKYRVFVNANITEYLGREKACGEAEMAELGDKCAKILQEEMEEVIKLSRETGRDMISAGTRVRMKNPVRWESIKSRWQEIFPKLTVTVEVVCRVRRPYDIDFTNGVLEEA